MIDINDLTARAGQINEDSTPEFIGQVQNDIAFLKDSMKEIVRLYESSMTELIKLKGPQQIGHIKSWLGRKKNTKCTDRIQGLDIILLQSGGDMAKAAEFFSGQPFKHGACRTLMTAEQWDKVFTTIEEDVLEEKTLQSADVRFVR